MLADGSREIWRRVAEEPLYADFCLIVDFYHASENNRSKMHYATYRAQGLPIGSEPVEAACKTLVGQRLKRSSMRWSIAGGQNILNLRVLTQSKRWDVFWKMVPPIH